VALSELRSSVPESESGKVRRILSSGVSLHAKAIMVDGKFVLIGSMNLDPRSRMSNTEIAVLIDSNELGLELGASLDEAHRSTGRSGPS
jgi:cardiolipin synthase C